MDDYQKRLDTMKAILKANQEKKKQEQQREGAEMCLHLHVFVQHLQLQSVPAI